MAENKKECKVVNLQDWVKNKEEREKEKRKKQLLRQILDRGNPLDRTTKEDDPKNSA